jgi:hypothetical protein
MCVSFVLYVLVHVRSSHCFVLSLSLFSVLSCKQTLLVVIPIVFPFSFVFGPAFRCSRNSGVIVTGVDLLHCTNLSGFVALCKWMILT